MSVKFYGVTRRFMQSFILPLSKTFQIAQSGFQLLGVTLPFLATLCSFECSTPCIGEQSQGFSDVASVTVHDLTINDGWRRTPEGWIQLDLAYDPMSDMAPSDHLSLAQSWPAAWAACLALFVLYAASARITIVPRDS